MDVRTWSSIASFDSYCAIVSSNAAKKRESLRDPRRDCRSDTEVTRSFQSLIRAVVLPVAPLMYSVVENVVSAAHALTSSIASRIDTSPCECR